MRCATGRLGSAHVSHAGFGVAPQKQIFARGSLKKRGIKDLYLMGPVLDYCVTYSALDARQLGFNAHVILDGCRGIELEPGDIDCALNEMKRAGAVLLKSSDL